MIKRLLAAFLAMSLCMAGAAPVFAAAVGEKAEVDAADSTEIYRYKERDGEITIIGYNLEPSGDMIIPNEIDGKTVTGIGESAFARCGALTDVVIPDGVTTIGMNAFLACEKMKSVNIPSRVTVIESNTFSNCAALTSVTIGTGVSSVEFRAFYGCKSLTDVYYGGTEEQWEKIEIGSGNSDLTDAVIHYESAEEHEYGVWQGLTYEVIGEKVVIVGCESIIDSAIEIPSEIEGLSVAETGDSAFKDCSALTEVTIPESVRKIGRALFEGCTELTVIFEGDAPKFDKDAFLGAEITACYPYDNATWTESVLQNYGGNVTWSASGAAALPELDAVNHINYINGKGEGRFDPNGSLTRAAAAKMIAALLTSQEYGDSETEFSDVDDDAWYAQPVELLASWGILNGYENEDGEAVFRPNDDITRAEFVAMLCRFYDVTDGDNPFSDVEDDNWAAAYIATAAENGWVNGYEDGSFAPLRSVTRAEAVKIINAVLDRSAAEEETTELIESMGVRIFIDVEPEDWYYRDVMEASIPHEYEILNSAEVWSELLYVSCGYDTGWNTIGDFRYYVNENGQFVAFSAGIWEIEGKYCYVDEYGRIPLNAAGKYTIDGSDCYVNELGQIPQNAAGIYPVSDTAAYRVNEWGRIDALSEGPQEIGGKLYYGNDDGTMAINTAVGYLYFDENGEYTSGNTELDNFVDEALASCVTSSMTREEKLRAAYIYVRDNFKYLKRDYQPRGSTDWAEECAVWMFTYKKGNCYCFAAAFMYMARRLGYQAYPVAGGVGTKDSEHGWVMIPWEDGVTYIFDVELDYAYRYRYSRGVIYDLYKFTPETAPFPYHFPS